MNVGSWLVWGFAATVVLTTMLAGSQGLRLTRMNIPYLLGTIVSSHRDRARIAGTVLHLINAWLFALVYVATFHAWGGPAWWKGALIGLTHALFVLAVGMPALPGLHPRMAGAHHGPSPAQQLEPPGFFALNYGVRTPIWVVVAHIVYGVILGLFYRV